MLIQTAVKAALENAGFVIAFSAFTSELIQDTADIILPIVPFSETDGTFVNLQGDKQSFKAAAPCYGEARPGWKVLRVFGNMLELEGYEYVSQQEIFAELNQYYEDTQSDEIFDVSFDVPDKRTQLLRIAQWPLYRSDAIVRRSGPLQKSAGHEAFAAQMNKRTAEKHEVFGLSKIKVTQNQNTVEAPLVISENVPNDCIYLASAYTETKNLGEAFGTIEVEK